MKEIKIYSSDNDPLLIIGDKNSEPMEKYVIKLCKLLESSNVSIIHVSSGSVIIRPNIISAIVVTGTKEEVVEEPKKPEKSEDIIFLKD
jgi:hypothetical protein